MSASEPSDNTLGWDVASSIDVGLLHQDVIHADVDPAAPVDVSIVVPVNARSDMRTVWPLLDDLQRYEGPYAVEALLLVNNFSPNSPPEGIAELERRGARVVAIPNVRRDGVRVHLAARVEGTRHASADIVILFDADCKVVNPSAIINWYVRTLRGGARIAYSRVTFTDMPDGTAVRVFIVIHHASRWFKRAILRIPTTRGSNYAVWKTDILRLYDDGLLYADMSVGPVIKAAGGTIRYSGARELTVLTSGRNLPFSWRKLMRYIGYAVRYNLRVLPRSGVLPQQPKI